MMLGHHLAFALRLIARNRAYAAITVGGLALGIAGCLMILSYVHYERGWDRWLPDHERIYQVQTTRQEPGQPIDRSQASPYPVRDLLPAGFPAIEAMSVMRLGPAPVVRDGEPVFVRSATVDPAFFAIFPLPFLHGSAATAFADTRSIVLTERTAVAQFGTSNVLGRRLTIGAGEGKQDYRVGGVLRDLPNDSSLSFDLMFRWDPPATGCVFEADCGWGAMSQWHFVKLRAGADAAAINAALPAWERRVVPPDVTDGRTVSRAEAMALKLVPIADVHLGEAQQAALAPGGDPRTLATFMIVAALTLGMAVLNFVNLSTARATQRAREVALRRVLGATRRQLITQLLVESLTLAAIATALALAIVELATPWVSHATGAALEMRYLGERGLFFPACALFILCGLAGGLYPALYASRSRPGAVLRANKSAVETLGSGRLRTALVAVQFAAAIGLVTCTWIIQHQTNFLATLDPGYRRNGLIQLDAAWRFAGNEAEYRSAERALTRVPGVVSAGRTDLALVAHVQSRVSARVPGGVADLSIGRYAADPAFFSTMGMTLLAGRLPNDARTADRIARTDNGAMIGDTANVMLNRAAIRLLGFDQPADAVGRSFRLGLGQGDDLTPVTIIGVVGDARLRTPRDPIEPAVFINDPVNTSTVLIRYAGADPRAVMAGIKRVWRKFEPEIPFQGRFAEDILAETYAAERARGALFLGFSGLAVMIACLGLYSLAAFATQRRTKEIGIRKVLGATVAHIVRLLAWQFSKPVVVANLIAWPVAWWAMRDWLNGFDTRIALTPTPFALAGLLALAIALATVASHALRVARMNPIHALRYE